MQTVLIQVDRVGLSSPNDVAKVRTLFKSVLYMNISLEEKKKFINRKLPKILMGPFMFDLVLVDESSYFLNIFVQRRKNIVMSGLCLPQNTLRSRAVYKVARILKTAESLERVKI